MKKIDFSGNSSVLLLLDDLNITSAYMMNVINTLLEDHKLCYISVAKTYDFIDKLLKEKKVDTGKMIYIDCVSHSFKHIEPDQQVEYISAPNEFREFTIAVKNALGKGYTSFIFDSVSALSHVVPAGNDALKRLYDSFAADLAEKKGVMVFMCSVKDAEKLLIQESMPVFEKIVHLGAGDSEQEEEDDSAPGEMIDG
jgi:hypothetical protein